ncbi:hypothetical protein BK649_08280 [Pseudomonas canadensis]|uniref:Dockerin domain-containing protein n=1 Tax=Pseudomonas canadensis TaxID=915099 RepID=A0A423FCN2_9PSED|nr:hypothetical protein [Pseudomonas canadensis]ROM54851.1 hypothetical protein BK649_08280 [Pseudomonas canadensis]
MRYLKATAQDRTGNGIADTVILHFYERCSTGVDELVHEAFAVDLNVDDVVDLQCSGDINSDGKINIIDTYFLKAFANSFLRLSWFNRGESWLRTLVVAAIQNQKEGPPNGVQLNFLERRSAIRKPILTYQAAGYDADGNGVLESFTRIDADRNGIVDKADEQLIRSMCNSFLALEWYDAAP